MGSNLTSICERCGNGVGYQDIHEAIHVLIEIGDIANDPNPQLRNSMILEVMNYLSFFKNRFINHQAEHNFHWSNACTPIQRIDRELRHVLQPRKNSKKSKDLETERYEHHKEISKELHEIKWKRI